LIAIGYEAAYTSPSGYQVAIGYGALHSPTTSTENIAIGTDALRGASASTAQYNVAIGNYSLDGVTNALNNVGIGRDTLTANTTGDNNITIGYEAGATTSTASDNTLVGHKAGKDLTSTTGRNVMIGSLAGTNATTVDSSTFIGYQAAGDGTTTGDYNTAIGYQSLAKLGTGGELNVGLGHRAGYNITTGYNNTYIGGFAGQNVTTGAGNVMVGYKAGPSSTNTESNKLYIHNDDGTPLIAGDFSSAYVTINGNLNTHNMRPLTNDTYTLGTASLKWQELHISDIIYNAGYIYLSDSTGLAGTNRIYASGANLYWNTSKLNDQSSTAVEEGTVWFGKSGDTYAIPFVEDEAGRLLRTETEGNFPTHLSYNPTLALMTVRNSSFYTMKLGGSAAMASIVTGGDTSNSDTALATSSFVMDNAGGGASFGSDNQIPYTNAGGDDFDYSANLTFDGTDLFLDTSGGGKLKLGAATEYIQGSGSDMRIHASDHVLIDAEDQVTIRASDFAWETDGGSEKMRFKADTGRLGIGTNAPAAPLHVRGSNVIFDMASEAAVDLDMGGSTAGTRWRISPGTDFRIYDNWNYTNQRFTIKRTSGYVGIADTSPPSTLGIDGAVSIKERADHETVTAGYGQLWVKNAAPNELYFTDDAGTDVQLGTGAGGANLVLSNLDVATAINTSLVSDADNTDDLGSSANGWRKVYCKEYNGFNTNTASYEVGATADVSIDWTQFPQNFTTSISAAGGIVTNMLTQQGASDSKVKDNIQDYTTGLSLINQLEPKTWNWNDSQYGDISKTNYGLMADDLAAIDSSYTKVHSTDETHGEIKTISEEFANQYNVALLKAVKELSAKNDALEARIVELEGKL